MVNGYLITLSAFLLLGGWLGDRYGRRRIFVVGLVAYSVASLLCAVAPTLPALVAARLAQGVGAALLVPGSLAIIQSTFRPGERGRAIGLWSALGGIGAAVGPIAGGALVDLVGWRAVFVLPVPFAALAAALAWQRVPETVDEDLRGTGADVGGAILAVLALGGLSSALVEAPERGWSNPLVLAAAGAAAIAALAFVPYERRRDRPMLPPGVLAISRFAVANAITLVVYAALGGVFFLLVVHLQVVLGYSAVEAGAATLPVTGLLLVLSPRFGALAERVGARGPLSVGPLVLAAGMLLIAAIGPGDGYATAVLPAVAIFGLGLSALVAPVTSTALDAVPDEQAGIASGVNNTVARAAQLLAVAALPALAGLSGDASGDPEAFAAGFPTAMWIAAGLAVAGSAIAAVGLRDPDGAGTLARGGEPT